MEEKRKPNVRKSVMIASIICALILVGILGSYAFFISQVGQNKNQEVSVQAGNMALTFSDGNNGFSKELDFGQSAEKTFTVENTGSVESTFSILWMDIENTYLEGSLTYLLEESDSGIDGTYTEIVKNKNVPVSSKKSDIPMMSGITIQPNATKYYKLTITLNYTEKDQTADLKASLYTKFKIIEGIVKEPSKAEKVLAKLGKPSKSSEGLNFALQATTDETKDGLYELEDDYGTSYYYRGDVEDNYVNYPAASSGA